MRTAAPPSGRPCFKTWGAATRAVRSCNRYRTLCRNTALAGKVVMSQWRLLGETEELRSAAHQKNIAQEGMLALNYRCWCSEPRGTTICCGKNYRLPPPSDLCKLSCVESGLENPNGGGKVLCLVLTRSLRPREGCCSEGRQLEEEQLSLFC